MLSRELVRSTRALVIQHLVFGGGGAAAINQNNNNNNNSQMVKDKKFMYGRKNCSSSSGGGGSLQQQPSQTSSEVSAMYKKSIMTPLIGNESVIKGKESTFEWEISGHESQVVQLKLDPGSSITAETGALLEMSSSVEMDTSARGGFLTSFKRMFTGQGLFLTKFKNVSDNEIGRVTFSSPYISKILAVKMSELGGELICKKNSFLCGDNAIEIEPQLTKRFSIGFFGGEGFILQRLKGSGMAFLHGCGSIIFRSLQPGEKVRVSVGSIVAFQTSVEYDIEWVKGATNIFFSGEGLFLTTLSGPGLVILQSLPFEKLVNQISRSLPSYGSSSSTPSSSSSPSNDSGSSSTGSTKN
ncbi:hypothetical protein DFA_03697 [Cavenderia fasciculata]|uniref:Altered inheritance of mitochondria protein 24, mitochondrial n=1 Tax=Cavenderia fasciculata TaxID=261658 RepID=F4Q1R0_CACFS|nr:uncharacterized protein DFA_03697 [Cavenderia fasciculata]EGG18210.1 hypothetical protein DFA_03697 [Cavenderia fasciculata]|eukprot:XP_004357033.1 hypothetical protein DFA_03697 [Cavenderia fasciculata]